MNVARTQQPGCDRIKLQRFSGSKSWSMFCHRFDAVSGHPIESCTPTYSAEAIFPSSAQKQYTKRLSKLLEVASGTASWSWHTTPR
jgi:hypothetical protein